MGIVDLLLLALGVSMDAFAVSVCKGLAMQKATLREGMICGVWFGGFQALMPTIGFFLGTLFAEAIEAVDHWVAFILLAIIGINSRTSCPQQSRLRSSGRHLPQVRVSARE